MPEWALYVFVPSLASLGGGSVAAFRRLGRRSRAAVQLFTGGVIFAAVAVELLPQLSDQRPVVVAAGFAAGTAVMLGVKVVAERAEARGSGAGEGSLGLVLALATDTFIDGALLGVAFATGAERGFVLAFALTLEALFLNMSATTAADAAGASRGRVLAVAAALAVLLALSAAAGVGLFSALPGGPFHALVAFGVAALLYSVVEELVVEAHEEGEPPLVAAMFFLGFLVVLLLELA